MKRGTSKGNYLLPKTPLFIISLRKKGSVFHSVLFLDGYIFTIPRGLLAAAGGVRIHSIQIALTRLILWWWCFGRGSDGDGFLQYSICEAVKQQRHRHWAVIPFVTQIPQKIPLNWDLPKVVRFKTNLPSFFILKVVRVLRRSSLGGQLVKELWIVVVGDPANCGDEEVKWLRYREVFVALCWWFSCCAEYVYGPQQSWWPVCKKNAANLNPLNMDKPRR